MKKVLIIGYGTVGHNLAAELSALQPDIYDKYKPDENTRQDGERYDVAFVCVDTPYVPGECVCDTREVENAILENDADIFVVKSTVLPGTVAHLEEVTGKTVIFSPEYYGGTQHCNNFDFPFTSWAGPGRLSEGPANPPEGLRRAAHLQDHGLQDGRAGKIHGERLSCHKGELLHSVLVRGKSDRGGL